MDGVRQTGDVGMGLTIRAPQERAIGAVLAEVAQKASAALVLLASRTGHFIDARGDRVDVDKPALASLVAADLSASQQIANLIDDSEAYQMILREGEHFNMLVAAAGERLVVLAVVPRKEPIGWVRILVKEAAHQLAEISSAMPASFEETEPAPNQGALSDLIGQALDELWTE